MLDRSADPRTQDTIVYELLRTPSGRRAAEVVGTATFRGGRCAVQAPEAISLAVREQLDRAFVDRVQSDERPRGYRRTGRGGVEMLVPGMAEHFLARMRGLWLSYPDGSVVTARAIEAPPPEVPTTKSEAGGPSSGSATRRSTLVDSARIRTSAPLRAPEPAGERDSARRRAAPPYRLRLDHVILSFP